MNAARSCGGRNMNTSRTLFLASMSSSLNGESRALEKAKISSKSSPNLCTNQCVNGDRQQDQSNTIPENGLIDAWVAVFSLFGPVRGVYQDGHKLQLFQKQRTPIASDWKGKRSSAMKTVVDTLRSSTSLVPAICSTQSCCLTACRRSHVSSEKQWNCVMDGDSQDTSKTSHTRRWKDAGPEVFAREIIRCGNS